MGIRERGGWRRRRGLKGRSAHARRGRPIYRRSHVKRREEEGGAGGEVYFVHLPFCEKGGLEAV